MRFWLTQGEAPRKGASNRHWSSMAIELHSPTYSYQENIVCLLNYLLSSVQLGFFLAVFSPLAQFKNT